ncbi:hypothetical protein ACFLQL_03715, partial [Verrucomicrobiota bacterium]
LYFYSIVLVIDIYYLEPKEEKQAAKHGYKISEFSSHNKYQSLTQYCKSKDVKIIFASEIKDDERTGDVPKQGYVWQD